MNRDKLGSLKAKQWKGKEKKLFANINVGTYHWIVCQYIPIKKEKVKLFDTCEEAETAGFQPCKKCNPRKYFK